MSDLAARKAAVLDKTDLVALIGAVVKLGRGRNPRGQCPFHGSTSDSFSISSAPPKGGPGFAHCFGCGWHGDAIKFVMDFYALDFMPALARLEADAGLDDLSPTPIARAKAPQARRARSEAPRVDSRVMGRHIWAAARPDADAVRTYLRGRGIPDAVLDDGRFGDIRFLALAPIIAWAEGKSPDSVPRAPAMVALVRAPTAVDPGADAGMTFRAIGVHVTYLSPDLTGKMVRERRDGTLYPERKMLGSALGGGVMLGRYHRDLPLFVGEGIETVLSGIALAGTPAAIGLAALSLDCLEGFPLIGKGGALPLHDIRPDPARPALAFRHDGPVTGLIDADMAALQGPIDRVTGAHRGLPVIERRGGPIVRRAITPAERADVCAALMVRSWRAAGCRRVAALRPPMGRDFNDAIREVAS